MFQRGVSIVLLFLIDYTVQIWLTVYNKQFGLQLKFSLFYSRNIMPYIAFDNSSYFSSKNICCVYSLEAHPLLISSYRIGFEKNMSLTIPNLVPQRPFCYLNFISVAKPQKFGNETYDAHVLASSKTYRKQNKPK